MTEVTFWSLLGITMTCASCANGCDGANDDCGCRLRALTGRKVPEENHTEGCVCR